MTTTANNNTTTTAVATTAARTESLMNAKGAVVGTRYFMGTKSASDIRATLKATGLKGNELTKKVNEALTSEGANRVILGVAWVQTQAQAGYLPDTGDLRKNTGLLRMVKPKATADAGSVTQEAALAALGITAEEFAAMKQLVTK